MSVYALLAALPALWHRGLVLLHPNCGRAIKERKLSELSLLAPTSRHEMDFGHVLLTGLSWSHQNPAGALKRWKSPRLKRKQMSGCFRILILCLSISPEIPSAHVCEEATAAAQWGQMAASGSGGQTASPVMCHHLTPAGHHAATEQQPITAPTSDHLHTRALGTHAWIGFLKSCSSLDNH